jgi:hypothetical protein
MLVMLRFAITDVDSAMSSQSHGRGFQIHYSTVYSMDTGYCEVKKNDLLLRIRTS